MLFFVLKITPSVVSLSLNEREILNRNKSDVANLVWSESFEISRTEKPKYAFLLGNFPIFFFTFLLRKHYPSSKYWPKPQYCYDRDRGFWRNWPTLCWKKAKWCMITICIFKKKQKKKSINQVPNLISLLKPLSKPVKNIRPL